MKVTVLYFDDCPNWKVADPIGLSCRVHQTPDGPAGTPTPSQLGEVLA